MSDRPVSNTAAEPKRLPAPIPLTVLTGFLGAGKTTLLNRILKDPALAGTAVIINEFGEVGIDHVLVEKADDGIVELSSGCLCCTIRGDLVRTLEDLLRAKDNGRIAELNRVVVETTGLADPAPILHTIMRHPYLLQRYRLDGVVTLVDAVNGMATLDAQEEAVKQAAVADRIVLTKTDLVAAADRPKLALLGTRLKILNPAAPVLDAAAGEATPKALVEAGLWNADAKTADVKRWLAEEAYRDRESERRRLEGRLSGGGHLAGTHVHHDNDDDHHDHHHEHDHDHHGHDHDHHDHDHHHDPNRHDARIRAFCLTTDRPVATGALDLFLDLLRSAHGPKLLRVKGVVKLAEDPEKPLVLHLVQHVMHPPAQLAAWPDADHRTRLVFITKDLDEGFVKRMFDAFVGALAPDTPDTAAMMDNPLRISGFSGSFG